MSDVAFDPELAQQEHQALRAMRDALVTAYNQGQLEELVSLVDEAFVLTLPDGHVLLGRPQLASFLEQQSCGPRPRVRASNVDALDLDRLTFLIGSEAGVATGWVDSSHKLEDTSICSLRLRWTATLKRCPERWRLAALHLSRDGGSARPSRSLLAAAAFVALALGGALGWFLGRRRTC